MPSLNKVFLIGNLTRDPELRYTSNGTPVVNFGLAVNRVFRTQTGERREETCFVRVITFGKQAESCNQYLTKGRLVFVEGRLQYRSWESNGQKFNTLDVVADRVQFLDRGKEGIPQIPELEEEILPEQDLPQDEVPF